MRTRNTLLLAFFSLGSLCPIVSQDSVELSPRTLLEWKQIESVELSPSGRQVIYITKEANWKRNQFSKSIWVMSTRGANKTGSRSSNEVPQLLCVGKEKCESPQWSPDGKRIAFLSTRDGRSQIWIVDRPGKIATKVTNSQDEVTSFSWAPDGKRIGYIVSTSTDADDQIKDHSDKDKEAGVSIDKFRFSIYRLLAGDFHEVNRRNELWQIDIPGKRPVPLVNHVNVTEFAWSPDGSRVAVVFQPIPNGQPAQRTDVLIHFIAAQKSEVILRGTGDGMSIDCSGYSKPMWSPDGKRLALYFSDTKKRWEAKNLLGIYSFDGSGFQLLPRTGEVDMEGLLLWPIENRMLLETMERASKQLRWLSLEDGTTRPTNSSEGSDTHFSFSRDANIVAYVHSSTNEPPEIYISHSPFNTAARLTTLNASFDGIELPRFERFQWKSKDGTRVEGWLARPKAFTPGRKYPLLVILHGGPGGPVLDEFEMFAEWPYPYRLAALRGYLVLLPNYRGSGSYGATFLQMRDLAGEPADDVVAGIQALIGQGSVNRKEIGILGHSHGTWLGTQILTSHPDLFGAASFAEGTTNLISNYSEMPGWLNLFTHDYYFGGGGTPFGALQLFIDRSPVFHVASLTTPSLLEFGEYSLAVQGLDFQTALWRCGIPHELIIYPKSGHVISRPAQKAESMERNLDWFDYWLLKKTDPNPRKKEQYSRWEDNTKLMQSFRAMYPCSRDVNQ